MKKSTSRREAEVLAVMQDGQKRTRNHIADILKWRSGPVCGRVKSLLDKGILKVTGFYFDPDTEAYSEPLRISRKRKSA
jgi:DNA-binding Lrp family transcriptional regulator